MHNARTARGRSGNANKTGSTDIELAKATFIAAPTGLAQQLLMNLIYYSSHFSKSRIGCYDSNNRSGRVFSIDFTA